MKIAIQGHPTRGKEVIQILESLGGKNTEKLEGIYKTFYYIDDKNEIVDDHKENFPPTYNLYTLEEFEKEFPFKIGDKVTILTGTPYKIIALEYYMGKLNYKLSNGLNYDPKVLTLYKEMKEERNITLTLDKAKEWYKKGGELKEVALQAFNEKELKEPTLPSTWNEYLRKCPLFNSTKTFHCDRAKEISPRYEALIKLEYLRDCYRQRWKPDWDDCNNTKWNITGYSNTEYHVTNSCFTNHFLSFQSKEIADLFYTNFKDLIKQAGDLI